MRVLLVEHNHHFHDLIIGSLPHNLYRVDAVFDGMDGYHYLISGLYDVILINNHVPTMNGEDIIRRVRQENHHSPIILYTLKPTPEIIHVQDEFQDVYVVTPCTIEAVLAHVHALRRRLQKDDDESIVRIGNVECNRITGELFHQHKSTSLTNLEWQLLHLLSLNQNRIVSKRQIMQALWGEHSTVDENNVEVYISFLRKKLRSIEANIVIKTTRNRGYSLQITRD
ncbi:response regulator transcription factor [Candidatus Xianfuyuplasma coldseepsis]|uniref:Response regulator transcription factor n=1 Tax=Candidatus Xianfuyuplasma coldseepsis TaxID=2782163 RepID=A0A7L7KSV6_9MOLU|nr:response regulator transcription factor [Xianfuyuplasma coldseepsis]QMS85489.1 response regulator transcription factor [Xianfuyuplasma coldseepsis]